MLESEMIMLPKRILHIAGQMSIGGAERAIYQLIRGQRYAGTHADLLGSSYLGYYGKKVAETGARVFELKQKNGRDLSIRHNFHRILEKYDAVHFHAPNPVLMYLVSKRVGLKRYYTHRAGIFKYPFKRWLTYKLSGFFIKKSFTAISGNTKQAALAASRIFRIPLSNIAVTYNGIDFSLLEPKRSKLEVLNELDDKRSNLIRIGTTSNIRDWKRIDYLLKSVAELREMSIHCYVIGDGPERPNLERLTHNLRISNLVSFPGKKEHIGDYLQIFDIFVFPSNHSESFGNSAVEAMGMGIPTIVMQDGGGLVEHITEGGGFIAEHVEDITIFIKKLCQSKELRCSVGEKGKRYVLEKYSIENMIRGYENLYSITGT